MEENVLIVFGGSVKLNVKDEKENICWVCGGPCYTLTAWPIDSMFACTNCSAAVGGLPKDIPLIIRDDTVKKVSEEFGVEVTKQQVLSSYPKLLKSTNRGNKNGKQNC